MTTPTTTTTTTRFLRPRTLWLYAVGALAINSVRLMFGVLVQQQQQRQEQEQQEQRVTLAFVDDHPTNNYSWIRPNQEEENGTLPPPPPGLPQSTKNGTNPWVPSTIHNTTTTTTTSTTRNTIALHCLLDSRNTFCYVHFPHTLQALSQCWSYFQSQTQEILEQHSKDAAILPRITTTIHSHGIRGRFQSPQSDWRAAFVQFLLRNVTTRHHARRSTLPHPNNDDDNRTHSTRIFRPTPDDSGLDGLRFFWNYSHVQALHDNLYQTELYRRHHQTTLGETVGRSDKQSVSQPPRLRIAVINRKTARRIVDINQLERAIRQEYPQALVQVVTMEGMTPLQQYIWWNQQSIVVTPHGAATTNLIFMKPGSAVLELYQPHYYWWGFWKLAQTARVRYYAQFPILLPNATSRNHSSHHHTHHTTTTKQHAAELALFQDFIETCSDWPWQRHQQKLAVLEPSIPHVMVLLRRAVRDWQQQGQTNISTTTVTPQIVRMETNCRQAQAFYQQHKNDNNLPEQIQTRVQLSLDDDPAQYSLLAQYGE